MIASISVRSEISLYPSGTLSRLENMVSTRDLRRLSDWHLDLYLKTHPGPRKVIVLDMDATDDPTHGQQ